MLVMWTFTRGYIPLNPMENPIKPPFSYGFPMVFLWFSYGKPAWRSLKKSPSHGRRHGIHQLRIFSPRRRPQPPWRRIRRPSGKRWHNYGTSQFFMGKSTINGYKWQFSMGKLWKITIFNGKTHYLSMAMFNSYFDITRGYQPHGSTYHGEKPSSLRRYHREFVGKCGKIKVTAAVAPFFSRRSTLPYHQPKGLPAAGWGLKSLCAHTHTYIYIIYYI